jgi:hypothetical protein
MGSIRSGSGADRKARLSTEFSDRSHPGTVIACANKHEGTPALEGFSPTREMPESSEAQALMGRLA